MDRLRVERAHFVGCSMGGSIAIDLALEHPARVSKLVLVGSALRGYIPPEGLTHVFGEERAARESGDMDALNQALMHLLLDGPNRPRGHVGQPLRDLFLDMNGRAIRVDHSRAPQRRPEPPAIGRLREIKASTLVVVGDSDLPHVLDIAEVLASSICDARKTLVRDAAHLPNLEHPDEFNRVVLDFLLDG
jgi:pimeloyl-ACP methyl ester carboxylesterase